MFCARNAARMIRSVENSIISNRFLSQLVKAAFVLQGRLLGKVDAYFSAFRRCNYPRVSPQGVVEIVQECGRYSNSVFAFFSLDFSYVAGATAATRITSWVFMGFLMADGHGVEAGELRAMFGGLRACCRETHKKYQHNKLLLL